ncbi:MAG: cyclic nucleotide-binding domain-containing protein [Spirochaetaceae bacterium]|nr:cyclic nucleotide-binding domain-containing protein [Spirochaetaceae bacterium]
MSEKSSMKKKSLTSIVQHLYLTVNSYLQNNLITYASSCAFGFMFSLIPVVIMIVMILIRVLHISPETIISLFDLTEVFIDTKEITNLIASIFSVKKFGLFEIFLIISILLMAQRFFFSVMAGFQKIFHTMAKPRKIKTNIFIIIGEIIIVLAISLIIFLLLTVRSLFQTDFISSMLDKFLNQIGQVAIQMLPSFLIFIITSLTYHFASRTRPRISLCFFSGLLTTLCFMVVQNIFSNFLDITRYNLIYGVFGTLMVYLLEVCIFFYLFFFFAQLIYTIQFFDYLLLCELYLLQGNHPASFNFFIRKLLFIQPNNFKTKSQIIKKIPQGEFIYSDKEVANTVYYVINGSIKLIQKNTVSFVEKGEFFGETECLLNIDRNATTQALTEVTLLVLTKETFLELLNTNSKVAQKAMTLTAINFPRMYGEG